MHSMRIVSHRVGSRETARVKQRAAHAALVPVAVGMNGLEERAEVLAGTASLQDPVLTRWADRPRRRWSARKGTSRAHGTSAQTWMIPGRNPRPADLDSAAGFRPGIGRGRVLTHAAITGLMRAGRPPGAGARAPRE